MAEMLLDQVGFLSRATHYASELSGGEQQRISLARALMNDPEIIFCDEPTGNLHTSQGEMIMALLKELHQEGMTIIQVTHNEKFATYGTRIIQLEDGFVRQDTAV